MSRPIIEPMLSPAEVAARWGVTVRHVRALVALGARHGRELHPSRGGLWPTLRLSHKVRRIPVAAVERHEAHMSRVAVGRPLPGVHRPTNG